MAAASCDSGNPDRPFRGARKLIEQALEAELATLLAAFADHKLEDGRARLVRHGHLPEREVLTDLDAAASVFGPIALPLAFLGKALAITRFRSDDLGCADVAVVGARAVDQ